MLLKKVGKHFCGLPLGTYLVDGLKFQAFKKLSFSIKWTLKDPGNNYQVSIRVQNSPLEFPLNKINRITFPAISTLQTNKSHGILRSHNRCPVDSSISTGFSQQDFKEAATALSTWWWWPEKYTVLFWNYQIRCDKDVYVYIICN